MTSTNTIEYIHLLEKTNEQLNLWITLANIFAVIIGLVIAILAITTAIILWRLSAAHKKLIDNFLKEKGAQIDDKIKKLIAQKVEAEKDKGDSEDFEKTIKDIDQQLSNLKHLRNSFAHHTLDTLVSTYPCKYCGEEISILNNFCTSCDCPNAKKIDT